MEEQALRETGPRYGCCPGLGLPTSLQLTPSHGRTDSKPTASSLGMGLGGPASLL